MGKGKVQGIGVQRMLIAALVLAAILVSAAALLGHYAFGLASQGRLGPANSNAGAPRQGGGASLTVRSITWSMSNVKGTQFDGMRVWLYSPGGNLLAGGYTPVTFNVASGTYLVNVSASWENYTFYLWGDENSSMPRIVNVSGNATLSAWYNES